MLLNSDIELLCPWSWGSEHGLVMLDRAESKVKVASLVLVVPTRHLKKSSSGQKMITHTQ